MPSTGTWAKRILHGALKVWSGTVLWLLTTEGGQESPHYCLRLLRAPWRGAIVCFEDRGSLHTAAARVALARDLAMELRCLPQPTPALNALDHWWRRVTGDTVATRATQSVDASAASVCRYLLALPPHDRLRQARVLSTNLWLTN